MLSPSQHLDLISTLQVLHNRVAWLEARREDFNPMRPPANAGANPYDNDVDNDDYDEEEDTWRRLPEEEYYQAIGPIVFTDVNTPEGSGSTPTQYYRKIMRNGAPAYTPVVIIRSSSTWGTTMYKVKDKDSRSESFNELDRSKLYQKRQH